MKFSFCKNAKNNKVEIVIKTNCCNRKKLTYTFCENDVQENTERILRQIKTMLESMKDLE